MATKKPNTRVRFLGGYAPRRDMLGVLSYPVVLDGTDEEHTRFIMTNGQKWVQRPIDADLVSVIHEVRPPAYAWTAVGKRGDVHVVEPGRITVDRIADAGTGPGKLGYLASIRRIGDGVFACGFSHQVYERVGDGWVHRDDGLRLGPENDVRGLNDIAGDGQGRFCAVGDAGEIAFDNGRGWALLDSPTNEDLHAVCRDPEGRYAAAGGGGIVVRGGADGFEVLCTDPKVGNLWDIVHHGGELVVAASAGLFVVRDGALVPFDRPAPPRHVGYKFAQADGVLWSIGTDQIFCLDDGRWTEWVCPDNA